jgi:hypothetical protein
MKKLILLICLLLLYISGHAQTLETTLVNPGYLQTDVPYSDLALGIWIPTQYENISLSFRYNTYTFTGSAGAVYMTDNVYIRLAPITSRVSSEDLIQVGFPFTPYCFAYVTLGEIGFTYLWR